MSCLGLTRQFHLHSDESKVKEKVHVQGPSVAVLPPILDSRSDQDMIRIRTREIEGRATKFNLSLKFEASLVLGLWDVVTSHPP